MRVIILERLINKYFFSTVYLRLMRKFNWGIGKGSLATYVGDFEGHVLAHVELRKLPQQVICSQCCSSGQ